MTWKNATLTFLVMASLILSTRLNSCATSMDRRYSVADRITEYGEAARARLTPYFNAASIVYPPRSILLVALKEERELILFAEDEGNKAHRIHTYKMTATSGALGPKLKEGDYQIPEGIYKIEAFNPNSAFHLSLRLNYPNKLDLENAHGDGRTELGGDIMIHGGTASVGCIAVGDSAAEDLFVLAADVGKENVEVIILPRDPTRGFPTRDEIPTLPSWAPELYELLHRRTTDLPFSDRTVRFREEPVRTSLNGFLIKGGSSKATPT